MKQLNNIMKPYNKLTNKEKLACISHYTEEAKKDSDTDIRQEAYRTLGFTEEAKKDKHWAVRQEAYRILGFTEEAKKDSDPDIRQEAEIYERIIGFKNSTEQEAIELLKRNGYKIIKE
jgi:hypothetical protein